MSIVRISVMFTVLTALLLPSTALATETAEITREWTAAYRAPGNPKAKRLQTIHQYIGVNDQPNRLPIVAKKVIADKTWLQVRLMRRPNGSLGWIQGEHAQIKVMRYQIKVDLSARGLWVFDNGKKIRFTRVVVGAPSTPTPTGHFYAVDGLRLDDDWAVHGWALATSAFSNVLRNFAGGEGQVAIHTTGRLRDKLGTASSHGCVRVPPRFAKWLALRMPNGTPIDIVR